MELLQWVGGVLVILFATLALGVLFFMLVIAYLWTLLVRREFRASEPRVELLEPPPHAHDFNTVIRGETDEKGSRVVKACRCGETVVENRISD